MVAAWLAENIEIFKEQFASIGIEHKKEAEENKTEEKKSDDKKDSVEDSESVVRGAYIEQHSYNMFKFFATGRINCDYCLVTLELKRRQDIFTMTTFNILWPEIDKITYEIPLSFNDMFPCVFSVVKRNEMKALLEDNKILVIIFRIF